MIRTILDCVRPTQSSDILTFSAMLKCFFFQFYENVCYYHYVCIFH